MMFRNQTKITEFILLGFGEFHNFQIVLFLIFLLIYTVTITGNVLIAALVVFDRRLHTPMYFFLGNLSILEACSSSNILPRMISALGIGERRISFSGCFAQWYLCGSLLATECCLLCAMSYDRFLAICRPLHYGRSMDTQMCIQLAGVSWINGFTAFILLITLMLKKLVFCGVNVIDFYFCDTFPLLKLSCSDTSILETVCFVAAIIIVFLPFLLILTSYVHIIATVLKIPSSTGRKKAFSICSSHLIVVSFFYGTLITVYIIPNTEEMRGIEKFSSLLYTVLPPLANPFIYSLRNKEVKNALKLTLVRLCYDKHVSL